jgi:hypothetical protein
MTSVPSDGTLKFAIGKETNNAVTINVKVQLLQGTTEIASWTYNNVAFGFSLKTEVLTGPQLAAISDFSDLRVRVTANPELSFATIFGADLHAWYDASDAATITESSGLVSQWNDKSGNAFHLTQPTSARRPIYSATGLGGAQPAVTFTFFDLNALGASITWPSSTDEFAVFMVGRMLTGTANYGRAVTFDVSGSDVGASAGIFIIRSTTTNAVQGYRNGDKSVKAIALDTTARIASVFANGEHKIYVDGSVGTTVAETNGALSTTGTLFVGAGTISGPNGWDGPICEVAILKREPTSGELSQVDAMLAAKWTA